MWDVSREEEQQNIGNRKTEEGNSEGVTFKQGVWETRKEELTKTKDVQKSRMETYCFVSLLKTQVTMTVRRETSGEILKYKSY